MVVLLFSPLIVLKKGRKLVLTGRCKNAFDTEPLPACDEEGDEDHFMAHTLGIGRDHGGESIQEVLKPWRNSVSMGKAERRVRWVETTTAAISRGPEP